jgi:hypothetical protein
MNQVFFYVELDMHYLKNKILNYESTRLQEIDCNTFKLFYSKNKTCIYIQVERKERENYLNFILKSNYLIKNFKSPN